MAVKTVQAGAANYVKGMAGAAAAYTAGTAAVMTSPMAAAAANLAKAAAAYQDAVSSGRMAAALNAVPLSDWKTACSQAGPRLASGAQKGQTKWMKKIAPYAAVWSQMKPASQAAGDDPVAKYSAALAVLKQVKASQGS